MPNYLKIPQRQQAITLLELGWTYRRIEAETGVRRETVSRYDRQRRSNAAKVFPGSEPNPDPENDATPVMDDSNPANVFPGSGSNAAKTFPGSPLPARSPAAGYREAIVEKRGAGLSIHWIWQDLVEELGYGHSYESIKRCVCTLPGAIRVVGVIHADPGEEVQVDFLQGTPPLSRPVAAALGVPDDAVLFPARLRRGRVGASRERLPRTLAALRASSATTA